jgi:hypothetical protein
MVIYEVVACGREVDSAHLASSQPDDGISRGAGAGEMG